MITPLNKLTDAWVSSLVRKQQVQRSVSTIIHTVILSLYTTAVTSPASYIPGWPRQANSGELHKSSLKASRVTLSHANCWPRFSPFLFLPLSFPCASTGRQTLISHCVCSRALNPTKLSPSSGNFATSNPQFLPFSQVCSSQPEETVTVKGICPSAAHISLLSCFIQVWFYCLLQVWKPIYLPKGWMQPMPSLQMTRTVSLFVCVCLPRSPSYYCLLNICYLLLFSLNQGLLEAEEIRRVKFSQYISHFLQPFLGLIQKEPNGLLVLPSMSILTSLKYVLACSPQKVFSICNKGRVPHSLL